MIDWSALQNEQNEVQKYEVEWQSFETKSGFTGLLQNVLDTSFSWVNDLIEGRYQTIESYRKAMLQADPSLQMTNRSDGFELEAERLIAIQQRNSRGFTIIDINPGLLTRQEFPLTLPYEFIFDGTNFMPDSNESIISNFRTVNIPVQGSFVKIEYLWENNSRSNLGSANARPYAARKYTQIAPNELDLATGRQSYSLDNFARNKVFLNFSSVSEKPIIVKRSGDSFSTWFNELNITLNMGAPKIRVIIGMNSEVQEGPSNDSINANMALTGASRLFADSDTVLTPFAICEQDNFQQIFRSNGIPIGVFGAGNFSFNVIQNLNAVQSTSIDYLGYSVLWITRLRFRIASFSSSTFFLSNARINLLVVNPSGSEYTRVHTFTMNAGSTIRNGSEAIGDSEYIFTPEVPVRVTIPSGCALTFYISTYSGASITWEYSFEMNGYSLGEIVSIPVADLPGASYLVTSKYITDSTFLSDLNRVSNIRRYS